MSDPEDDHRLTRRYTKNLPSEEAALLFSDLDNPPRGRTIARTPVRQNRSASEGNGPEKKTTTDENKISELSSATSNPGALTPGNLQDLPQSTNMAEQAVTYLKPRDVVNTVPKFSGGNDGCTFREFCTACEDAKLCLPDAAIGPFTQLLKTRLSGTALQLTQGTHFATLKALLDHLKGIFAPRDSTLLLRGELGRIHQLYNEDVPSYLNRTRSLGNSIIEAYKSEHDDAITAAEKTEIEREAAQAFVLGLQSDISVLMGDHNDLNTAGLEAIKFESRLKSQAKLRLGDLLPTLPSPKPRNDQKPLNAKPESTPEQAVKTCNYCKRTGHLIQDCRRRQTTCSKCSKKGHFPSECQFQSVNFIRNHNVTSRNDNPSAQIATCQFCQQSGHVAKTCPKIKASNNQKLCQYCDKNGHTATECFKLNPDLALKSPTCSYCNILGHTQEKCRRRLREQAGNGSALPRAENSGEGSSTR